MIIKINSAAEGWWNWMWPMLWQVGILIVFIGAIDLLLRKRVWPQVRYALWLLVLIKLIIPPSFSLSTSIISQARIKADQVATQFIASNGQAEIPSLGLSSETNAFLTDIV